MSPRTTLAYGTTAIVVGTLWVTLSVQASLGGYVLAVALIFFGLLFLAYKKIKPESA
jgi:fatty acid desaturase